jgi:hypothetical protein
MAIEFTYSCLFFINLYNYSQIINNQIEKTENKM